jgi:hypothetical protein
VDYVSVNSWLVTDSEQLTARLNPKLSALPLSRTILTGRRCGGEGVEGLTSSTTEDGRDREGYSTTALVAMLWSKLGTIRDHCLSNIIWYIIIIWANLTWLLERMRPFLQIVCVTSWPKQGGICGMP